MSKTLKEIRAKYPEYDSVSDNDLAAALHRKYYSDMDQSEFYKRIEFSPISDVPPEVSGTTPQSIPPVEGAGDALINALNPVSGVETPQTPAQPAAVPQVAAPTVQNNAVQALSEILAPSISPRPAPRPEAAPIVSPRPAPRPLDVATAQTPVGAPSADLVRQLLEPDAAPPAPEEVNPAIRNILERDPADFASEAPGSHLSGRNANPRKPRAKVDQGSVNPENPDGTGFSRAVERGVIRARMTPEAYAQAASGTLIADAAGSDEDLLKSMFMEYTGLPEIPEGLDISTPEAAFTAIAELRGPQAATMFKDVFNIRASNAEAARGEDRRDSLSITNDVTVDEAQQRGVEAGKKLSELRGKAAALPMSPRAEEFGKAYQNAPDTFLDGLKVVASDPVGAATFFGEVAAESAPSIGASAAAGLITRSPTLSALTMGAGTVGQEYGASYDEFLEERNIKLETEEDAMLLLQNEELLREAAERGAIRSLVIASFEILGQGAVAKSVFKTSTANAALDTGVQAATGAGGEASARALAGQDMSAKEILAEALGETVTAPAEIGVAHMSDRKKKKADAAPDAPEAPTPPAAPDAGTAPAPTPDTPPQMPDAPQAPQAPQGGETAPDVDANAPDVDANAPEDAFEVMDEIEEVDGETVETGRKIKVNLRTGEATVVDAQEGAVGASTDQSDAGGAVLGNPSDAPAGQPTSEKREGNIHIETLPTEEVAKVETDAETFQYKDHGDQDGVTERLQGVKDWDERSAMGGIVYEYADGRRVVADGHQRLGLAKRLQEQGKQTPWNVEVIREEDGFTPQDVRRLAALKNIREGSGTSIDAAKVLRDSDEDIDALNLPPKSALVRDAKGLAKLSDDAFGMVVNEVVRPEWGAVVGDNVENPALHADVVALLNKLKPSNNAQAAMIAKQAGQVSVTETQDSLFGEEDIAESLYLERAKVLDTALKRIKQDKQTFKMLSDRAGTITEEGNVLDADANAQRVEADSKAAAYLSAEANRKGPISDALTAAAKDLKDNPRHGSRIVKEFLAAIRKDPQGAGRNGATDDPQGAPRQKGLQAEQREVTPDSAEPAKTEKTDAGEQTLIDGVEPITPRDRLEAAMGKPMEGGNAPAPSGRTDLFGDPMDRADLFDGLSEPAPKKEDSKKTASPTSDGDRVSLEEQEEIAARNGTRKPPSPKRTAPDDFVPDAPTLAKAASLISRAKKAGMDDFARGMEGAVAVYEAQAKGLTKDVFDFWESRIQEGEAQANGTAAPKSDKNVFARFIDDKSKFADAKKVRGVENVLVEAENRVDELVKEVNGAGYSINGIDGRAPKEMRDKRAKVSTLAALSVRVIKNGAAYHRGHKTANPERLEADIAKLYGEIGLSAPADTFKASEAEKADFNLSKAERALKKLEDAPQRDVLKIDEAKTALEKAKRMKEAAAQADKNPTDAQKEAGNYKMGHVKWQGLDITIENAKGSTRSKTNNATGKSWSVKMPAHYGYIKRTEGADGDHVDVYLGEDLDSTRVFVVDQVDAETGEFDEHKVLIGFTDRRDAEDTYDAGFSDGKGPKRRQNGVVMMDVAEFKEWVANGDTSKPAMEVTPPSKSVDPKVRDILLHQVEMGLEFEKMSASDAFELLERSGIERPSAARVSELLEKAAYIGNTEQGASLDFTHPDSEAYAAKGIAKHTRGERLWVKAILLDQKKMRHRGQFLTPTDALIEELNKPMPKHQKAGQYSKRTVPSWAKTTSRFKDRSSDFEGFSPENIGEQARDYVLENGKRTGNEHLILIDAEGQVVAVGEGTKDTTGTPAEFALFLDGSESLVIWHNHPLDVALSEPDIVTAAAPGVSGVYAVGHDGTVFYAKPTPAFRKALGYTGVVDTEAQFRQEDQKRARIDHALYNTGQSLWKKASSVLVKLANDGFFKDSKSRQGGFNSLDAGRYHKAAVTMALVDAGLIEAEVKGAGEAFFDRDVNPFTSHPELKPTYDRMVASLKRVWADPNKGDENARLSTYERHRGDLAGVLEGAERGRTKQGRSDVSDSQGASPSRDGRNQGQGKRGNALKKGKVGDKLAAGEVVLTSTGRKTTPFPKLDFSTERKSQNTGKRVNAWLIENARAEAEARGDDYNARMFNATDTKNPSQSDKDSAESYLFDPDFVFDTPAPITKPLTSNKPKRKRASKKSSMTSEETARLDAIKAKFADKMKNQLNAGLDPELVALAVEAAGIYIKAGARKFRDYVLDMSEDFGLPVSSIGRYARIAYNDVRDEMDANGEDVSDMDDSKSVIQTLKELNDVSSASENLERDSGEPPASDAVGATDVPASNGPDGNRSGEGRSADREGNRERDTGSELPESDASSMGEGGDSRLSTGERAAAEPSGSGDSGRSRVRGEPRLPNDRGGNADASQVARENADITDRAAAQAAADKLPVKLADQDNIRKTLPLLLPEQQEDVFKVESRYQAKDGHGMLITNGTGTGKTYTGLGVVKRFAQQGKTNTLILAPSKGILKQWIAAGSDLGLNISLLKNSKDKGEGIVATTFSNARKNNLLAKRDWDLVVPDEAQNINSNQEGSETSTQTFFRAVTNHPKGLHDRFNMLHADELAAIKAMKDGERKSARYAKFANERRAYVKKMESAPRSKVLFLSATPFAYDKSLDYAEGYLFNYPSDGVTDSGSRQDGRSFFFVENFGYRIRYHKLTAPEAAVDSGVFEREFHEKLKRSGALSGRAIDVDVDYDRKFATVHSKVGAEIDAVLDWVSKQKDAKGKQGWSLLREALRKQFDYLTRLRLLEAIKAQSAVEDIRKHRELGRKVVVFHDYNKGGGSNPFMLPFSEGAEGYSEYQALLNKFPQIEKWDFHKYKSPIETLTGAFGDDAMVYNGDVPEAKREQRKNDFNTDNNGKDIIIVQSAAGEAGLSLHDTTGEHQRVLINLGMPARPATTLQQEGRIYRVGSVTDAIYRYYTIGTSWERSAFAGSIADKSGTVENLALGEQARAIRGSFIETYLEASEIEPNLLEGTGGKERDKGDNALSNWDRAKTHYHGRMKNTAKRDQRKGVDFYSTPEPVGYKMAGWAKLRSGERVLEPSAGDGAIARYLPDDVDRTLIEPSSDLSSTAMLHAPGSRVHNIGFEDHNIVNKYNAVVMNPPYGSGGKTAIEHVAKAAKHLRNGGRIVALIPTGPSADKRFDAWFHNEDDKSVKNLHLSAEINLPSATFEKAGTKVMTRIVIIDRIDNAEVAAEHAAQFKRVNLHNANTVEELFDRIEDIDVPSRVAPDEAPDAFEDAAEAEEAARPDVPVDTGDGFKLGETVHAKTGEDLFVASLKTRVSKDAFKGIVAIAKKHDGWWSGYNRKGAIPGYQFRSPEDRAAFVEEVENTSITSKDQRPLDMYYSPLLRGIEGLKQKKAQAKDWKAILAKLPSVKKVELEWLGVEEWLDTQEEQQIPKEALEAFVRSNQIEIIEEVGAEEDDISVDVETNDAVEPDSDFIKENAKDFYFDDLREEAVAEHGEDGVDEDDVMRKAIERATDAYYTEPDQYEATVAVYNSTARKHEHFHGTYDAISDNYYFPDLFDDPISFPEIEEIAREKASRHDFEANFEQYTEGGGEDYKEILLRIPALHKEGKNKPIEFDRNQLDQDIHEAAQEHGINSEEHKAALKWRDKALNSVKAPFVQSHHFEQENVVVHARIKTRETSTGEKVLFVEEIQSDLASAWREGTEPESVTARRAEMQEAYDEANRVIEKYSPYKYFHEFIDKYNETAAEKVPAHKLSYMEFAGFRRPDDPDFLEEPRVKAFKKAYMEDQTRKDFEAKAEEAREESKRAHLELVALGSEKTLDKSIPDTPYKEEATYALMVKRLLRIAAEQGYDKLQWTPGYMQADRWDSAAQNVVEEIDWETSTSDNAKVVKLEMADEGGLLNIIASAEGVILETDDASLKGKTLSALLGPSVAKEILSNEEGVISGQKITFSDSGYSIAYDQQIKRSISRLAKKTGAKVELNRDMVDFYNDDVVNPYTFASEIGHKDMFKWLTEKNGLEFSEPQYKDYLDAMGGEDKSYDTAVRMFHNLTTEQRIEMAKDFDLAGAINPVWSIDITPDLREAAMRPMAILQKPDAQKAQIEMQSQENVASVLPDLRKELDRLNLKRVKLDADRSDSNRQGAFEVNMLGRMKIVIGASLDPMQTLRHEAVHALRSMNLFTPAEWKVLEAASSKKWVEKHRIVQRYPDLSPSEQIEEGIAEEFAEAFTMKKAPQNGLVRQSFNKIVRFFKALKNAVTGKGFQTFEDVFARMDSGAVGARSKGDGSSGAIPRARNQAEAEAVRREREKFNKLMDELDRGEYDEDKPKRLFEQSGKLSKARDSLADTLAKKEGGVELLNSNGSHIKVVVTRSQNGTDGWRVTYYDEHGFSGHEEHADKRSALRQAFSSGYDTLDTGGLRKAMKSGAFFTRSISEQRSKTTKEQRAYFNPTTTAQGRAHRRTSMQGAAHIPDRRIWEELTDASNGYWRRLGNASGAAYDWIDKARVRIQDRFLPVLRAQEAIVRKTGTQLPEEMNVYAAEETFSGKVGHHLFKIDEEFTKPIIEAIAATKGKLTMDDVGLWLYARHAKERNEHIARINPDMEDGGSGMTTAEAESILMQGSLGPHRSTLEFIGGKIDELREKTLAMREDSGLISNEDADLWRNQYEFYVPLKGFEESDHADATLDVTGIGRRFNTRGAESKRALGRRSEAFNPLQAAITQAQEVAIRSEKNIVGKAVVELAKAHPSKRLWSVKKPKSKRYYNKTTGLVETRVEDPVTLFMEPNEMAVKISGQEHRIMFHDDRLARALGSVGADQMGWFVGLMSKFGRFFSSVNTMLDPEFVIRNAFRDMQAAQINIRSFGKDDRNKLAKAMLKSWPKAFAGAYRGQLNKEDSEWTRYYREFDEAGAKVSFWKMDQPEAGRADMEKRIKMAGATRLGKASRFAKFSTRDNPVLGFIERTNLAVDNAVRLAAYVEARKAGWSKQDAASLSKNLTVNFNRRGEWGATINALYPFSNAALQGTQILFRAMTSKRMAKYGVGMVALGAILDMVNAGLSEEDEDGELAYDKIPDYKQQTNLIVMLGPDSGSAAGVWLPYGYNTFPYMGVQISKVLRGVKDPEDAIADFAGAVFGAFSPISGGSVQQTLTPTVLDPINEMAMNEDWLGRPIRPENPYGDYGPDAYKYYGGASLTSRAISDIANKATGGTVAESGALDVSPEYIDHVFGFLSGGAGRFLGRAWDVASKTVTGNASEIEGRNIPFYRSVKIDTGVWMDRDRYYRFRDELNEAKESAKLYREAGQPIPEHVRKAMQLDNTRKEIEKVLRENRKQRRALDENKRLSRNERDRRKKIIYDREQELFLRFNKRFVKVMGPQAE
ncbi:MULTISPECIES: LPD38 domain-containing protein [Halocynthiibacter]|uniref:DEAD/DEAH box helicase family protein n=1 Tax=Halocynthiibacter halioticoli TaxID=2986804 RepID=A0AAE3J388_9RHOB|nr:MULTISPECIES: LPD38 domain-containing protein [Halocynthiibacter]MCV6825998.1 DEAD/DEAH box helicase family protein [Halocynthiibacter halioticoli]MCW4058999.1 DEAD/DEAH box helicase family protein [Halocynthiibacter sp. SDUM655004]